MEYNLNNFLNGATVIPFRDDTLSELETICNAYIEDEDPLSIIDEMSSYLYADIFPSEFSDFLQNSILSQFNIGIKHVSESMKIRLAQYILYLTIINEEDLCERSFLCSNWMNYIVLKHKNLTSLPNSLLLSHLYHYHIHSYVQNLYNKRSCNGNIEENVRKLLSLIPATDHEDGNFEFDNPSVWNALRQICDEAILLRIKNLVSKFNKDQFDIKTLYLTVKGIVDLLEYPYYNIDIVNTIDMVLNGKRNTQSELWKYVEYLQNAGVMPVCNLDSSIILRAIRHKSDLFDIRNKSLKLSIKEFAVYLFYELLLEKIELTKIQDNE